MSKMTADDAMAAAAIAFVPTIWAGSKAARWGASKARNAGMRYQNWRYGGAGAATPATSSTASPAGTGGGKWGSVETKSTTSYYHTTATKWSK